MERKQSILKVENGAKNKVVYHICLVAKITLVHASKPVVIDAVLTAHLAYSKEMSFQNDMLSLFDVEMVDLSGAGFIEGVQYILFYRWVENESQEYWRTSGMYQVLVTRSFPLMGCIER